MLDQHVAGRQYMVGDTLTIAALTIACSLMFAQQTRAPLSAFPRIGAWFSRISGLDAWRQTNPH